MKTKVIHYAGALRYRTSDGCVTDIVQGWAACCYGDRAWAVRRAGNHSHDRSKVTCKVCLNLITKEVKKENAA